MATPSFFSILYIMLNNVSGALSNNFMVIIDAIGLIAVGITLVFSTKWAVKRLLAFMQWSQDKKDFRGYEQYKANRERQDCFRSRFDFDLDV